MREDERRARVRLLMTQFVRCVRVLNNLQHRSVVKMPKRTTDCLMEFREMMMIMSPFLRLR